MQIDRNVTIEYGYVYPEDVFLNCTVLGEHEEKRTLIRKKGDIKEESLEMYNNFHGLHTHKVDTWAFFDNAGDEPILLDKGYNSVQRTCI